MLLSKNQASASKQKLRYHCSTHLLRFVFTLLLGLCSTHSLGTSQEESEEQLRKLKANIQELSGWLVNANQEKSGLIKSLRSQEKQISQTTLEIKRTKTKVSELLKELSALNAQLREQNKSLNAQKSYLIEELRALYLEGKQPVLKALLEQDNPQDSARYLTYFNYLRDARSDIIERFESDLRKLEKTQADILRRQTRLNTARAELEQKHQQLKAQSAQRKSTLAKLEKRIENKSGELDTMKANQARLEELLLEVERAISELELPDESSPFKTQKAKLPWPTRGKVVEYYGARLAQGKLRSNGIRISAKINAEVKAVHYGRVVFSDWLRGFGLIIIVDHGEGYLSLYGNNNSLLLDVGDWASPGETIAYAGNSGGRNQSSLYFEIRRNGKPLNPKKWLRK